jgi:uncharacterized protein (TIGR02270 family)
MGVEAPPVGVDPRGVKGLVNEDVVLQHGEEAAFLWQLRDAATTAPNYTAKELGELDERVEAHLEGLRVAGDRGWGFCCELLEREGAGEVFAAAVLAFESRNPERIEKVLAAGCTDPELSRGLISALGWLPPEATGDCLSDLLGSDEPAIRRVGIGGHAVQRRDPGAALADAIADADVHLRDRALKAAGELGRADLARTIEESISDEDEVCAFRAAWAAARLGQRTPRVLDKLNSVALGAGPHAERALEMRLRCLPLKQAIAWRDELRHDPSHRRLAAIATGIVGDPRLLDELITMMEDEELARVSGEAFAMITGVDLSYEDLDGDAPEGFDAGPTEDESDSSIELDPDEDLPWPVPSLVSAWLDERRARFPSGTRHIRGREMSVHSLEEALAEGNQRQRAAAALELGIGSPGAPLVEVRARGSKRRERY